MQEIRNSIANALELRLYTRIKKNDTDVENNVWAVLWGLVWCLFPELWNNEGNKHQNKIQVSV